MMAYCSKFQGCQYNDGILLIKIVIIIFNIIINIIVIENSNEKKLFIIGWFN
jgi:hypothetical protein